MDTTWTFLRLNQMITDKIEESLYLDYKAADSLNKSDGKKNEIGKDVSAFANSDGGTIIYGVSEYQDNNSFLPEKLDPINRNDFSKETLEQIMNSRISPRIHGLIITPITIEGNQGNQVVYVVDIPKSFTAHQAADKKYYRRFNFLSVPMDDWEIKDVINRQNKSLVAISFVPKFNTIHLATFLRRASSKLKFDLIATNVGNKVVKYCDCMIIGNERTAETIIPTPPVKDSGYFELYYTNEVEYKFSIELTDYLLNKQRDPILPQTFKKIGEIELYSEFFISDYTLKVTVALDDNRIVKNINGRHILDSIK